MGSFELISADASLAKFISIELHSEDAYLYEERELRLINVKVFGGSCASTSMQGRGGSLFL